MYIFNKENVILGNLYLKIIIGDEILLKKIAITRLKSKKNKTFSNTCY